MHEVEKESCCGKQKSCRHIILVISFVLSVITFGLVLYIALALPKIVSEQSQSEAAMKVWGRENWDRLRNEIYNTEDYKEIMADQTEETIVSNAAIMEMYRQEKLNQQQAWGTTPTDLGDVFTGEEEVSGEVDQTPPTEELPAESDSVAAPVN